MDTVPIGNAGKILAVDDTPENLNLLKRMLTRRGYQVELVTNGPQALEMVRADPPELILMDIAMPEMNGFEVSQHLKADSATRGIPVIFVSALDEPETKVKAFTFGGVDYITKPFETREVVARVQTHLTLYRMQREIERGRNMLDATINAVSELMIVTDADGCVIHCNQAALARLGAAGCSQINGRHAAELLQEVAGAELPPPFLQGEPVHFTRFLPQLGGWFEVAAHVIENVLRVEGYVLTLKDISVYKEAEARERTARQYAEALQEAGVVINSSLDINEVLEHILVQIERVIPHTSCSIMLVEDGCARIMRTRHYERYDQQAAAFIENICFDIESTPNLREMAHTGRPVIIDDTYTYAGWEHNKALKEIRSWLGVPLIAHSRVVAFISLDHTQPGFFTREHADQLAVFGVHASMAMENARLFNEVNQQATVDFLTGLYNRRHFFTLAEAAVQRARQAGSPISLIILDLDHLKEINSQYGHIVGGQSLQAVGRLCREKMPPHLVKAVYGGDEFAILLPGVEAGEACRLAEAFRCEVASRPIETYRGEVPITITLGVAGAVGGPHLTLEKLIDWADRALFKAKDSGRNCTLLWQAGS